MRYLRLKKNTDFQRTFKKGKRVFSPCLTLIYVPSDKMRMGIALSKKYGKAVKRNRIKRLIRAAFDSSCEELKNNYSIVVMPKISETYEYEKLRRSLLSCYKRIEPNEG